ncbi:MAG: hypothetical protein A4E63_02172 [Syntrophorhabdus sp. PtaU1.Bin050]|jgi:hypothetical protein|nr:MAG: hypothetical protein A4E63_02172 [Syntrophorhabdus sp. PtaU1.Bin050]
MLLHTELSCVSGMTVSAVSSPYKCWLGSKASKAMGDKEMREPWGEADDSGPCLDMRSNFLRSIVYCCH